MCAALALLGPAAACAQSPAAVAGDSLAAALQTRIVRSIVLEPHDVFDPAPSGRLHGAYELVNALHIRTRPGTLRTAVVLQDGKLWTRAAADETMRKLRALGYLLPEPLQYATVGADSVDVRVVTHDNWTTSPELNLESAGGQKYGAFSFTERNLLGLGTSVSLSYRQDPAGISRLASVTDNALFGSHARASVTAGNGASGDDRGVELLQPFWSEAATHSAGGHWNRSHADIQLFAFGRKAADFRRRTEETELLWGTGHRTADGLVQRLALTFVAIDREFAPSVLQPGAPTPFAGGTESLRIRRVAGEMRLWHPRYLVRRGVEQIDRDEDFDVGPQFGFKVGFAPQAFGSTRNEGYARLRLDLGADRGHAGFGILRASAETRLVDGFRESLGELHARWVQQPCRNGSLVFGAVMVAGDRMPRDFQLTLGGLTGLRAFPVRELSGTEVWRLNGEFRYAALREYLHLVSFGAAAFWDAGRAWGPGAEDEPWHHDAGLGLRLSLPHSTVNTVARFDIAWPVAPSIDGHHDPVFSFGSGQSF